MGLEKPKTLWLYKKAKLLMNGTKNFWLFKKKKIPCFSTPFHEDDVDFLESLKTPLYKVASFELNHVQVIKKISKTHKPIIISTGMAKLTEIELAFNTAKKFGAKVILLFL